MAKSIMIQGTMSNAGKSLLCAGLCRVFMQDGYKAAPFKSQNMALNSFITKDGAEMGRAQAVQAEAAGIDPDVRMNPILLKPTTDVGSQVIVNGRAVGNMNAMEYYRTKSRFIPDIMKAFHSLASEYDIIVIEGAGSPVEINLKQEDIVNMGLAKMLQSPVLLVGDIDRGGVFAQLYGTVALLEEDEKELLKGVIINKFRGDKAILEPGLVTMEELCKVPVLGVVPYLHVDIDDEDSLSEKLAGSKKQGLIDIAVIRLPRISNFTDLAPFDGYDFVSLRYVDSVSDLKDPDMIIIPGTKSTVSDLIWMRTNGLETAVIHAADRGKIVFGICGGYQMLGTTVSDPDHVEAAPGTPGMNSPDSINGMNLIDMNTLFRGEKVQLQSSGRIGKVSGPLSSLSGMEYMGYEIHMGRSISGSGEKADGQMEADRDSARPVVESHDNVYGTYVHGIFDAPGISDEIIKSLCSIKGIEMPETGSFDLAQYKERQYDILADAVRESLDMEQIYRILGVSR